MAVFRYKMQGILDIKEKLEDRAKQEFAEANMRLDAEKKKLDELQARKFYYMHAASSSFINSSNAFSLSFSCAFRSCMSSCNAALAFSTAFAARAIRTKH